METRSKGEKGVGLGLLVLVVLMAVPIWATPVDFYSDGAIQDGDVYDAINVWDIATVDMYGGIASQLTLNDTSVFNLNSGEARIVRLLDNSTINVYSGEISYGGLSVYGSGIAHIFGGVHSYHIVAGESGEIHIYGYDFELRQSGSSYYLSGFWKDGTSFTDIYLRGPDTYSRVTLHEVPEPITFMLLVLGGAFLKRSK